jgi:hypothetical protein
MGESDTGSTVENVGETGDLGEEMSVDRLNEAVGSAHVPLAVGTFAALGAALVLASFMSSAFTSGGGSIGVSASVSFALTLAPLLAVVTGTWAARDGSSALTATVGGVAGVFALYVSLIVFQAAIGGGSGGTVNIGPLIGLAIGTGIAAGVTASLVAAIERSSGGPGISLPWRSLAHPAAGFVALGAGTVVALFLADELASGNTGGIGAVVGAPGTVTGLAPVLAVVLGLVVRAEGSRANRAVATLLGAALGFLLAYLIAFGLAHILESQAMSGQSLQYGALIGTAVGVGIAGGLGSLVADRVGEKATAA